MAESRSRVNWVTVRNAWTRIIHFELVRTDI